MKKSFILIASLASLLLAGCNTVKGIATGLGTDNTPPPTPLKKVCPQVATRGLWLVSTGRSLGVDNLKLGPTIADRAIFTADPNGEVVATNPQNGRRIWGTNLSASITSGPAVNEGIVVVGASDGKVFALSETNGRTLWHTTVPNAILAAPSIGQGTVIIKTIDGKLLAFAAQSGQQLWSYDHGAPTLVMRHDNTPQIYGDRVITTFADGKLDAFSLSQGRLLWEQAVAIPRGSSEVALMVDVLADPAIFDGIVYVATSQGNIMAVNANNGKMLWQQDAVAAGYTGMAVNSDFIFVTDVKDNIKAFARDNGNLIWEQPQLTYRRISPPALVANTLVVGDSKGYLHWFAPQNGSYLAQHLVASSARIIAPPAPLANQLFVSGSNGTLSAWRVG